GTTQVALKLHGKRVRFDFPGLPQNMSFGGAIRGSRLSGTVRQGALRGTFSLRSGGSPIVPLLGAYRSSGGAEVAALEAYGLPRCRIESPAAATYGIRQSLRVGERLGDKSGDGAISVDQTGFSWKGTHYSRVRLRQREVRVGVDAGTLTLPSGSGRFPAAAMVHGSGPRTRDEFDIFSAYFALHGIAVLADDKRGVGESRGTYPGDAARDSAIDVLASDAQAEASFLAGLPNVDATRVGLFGDSQAGWIVPLAAARSPAVHWAVLNSGPTVTVGETDLWGQLAGPSQREPAGPRSEMPAQVRKAGPSGFDPIPYLRQLRLPALWLYGSDDRNVPTELCIERLDALTTAHDFSSVVLPTTHTPFILPTAL